MKKNGISLIILIITIIVVIVIASAVILSIADSDIIQKASDALEKYNANQEEQQLALDNINEMLKGNETVANTKTTDTAPGILETSDNTTYTINSIEDLIAFSNNVNSGTSYDNKVIMLGETLDFSNDLSYVDENNKTLFSDYNEDGIVEGIKNEITKGRGFIPIGNTAVYSGGQLSGNYFKGIFDGNNKSIQNILIDVTGNSVYISVGFFANLGGTVKNLTISGNIKVTNNTNLKTARTYIGAIAGQAGNATITNCKNTCNIVQTKNIYSRVCVAGIIGCANPNANIYDCSNYGTLNAGGGREFTYVGGICGFINNGKISGCINYANIENTYDFTTDGTNNKVYMGGIVGNIANKGVAIRTANIGNITSKGAGNTTSLKTGGIVGRNEGGKVLSSYNKGSILTDSQNTYTVCTAGIVGESCYLLGWGYIENCYNVGPVNMTGTSGSKYNNSVYGLSNETYMRNCYYLGTTELDGGAGISRKTEEQMKSVDFAQTVGPDFMKDPKGGYPIFETRFNYEYYMLATGAGNVLTAKIDAKAGDLVVATILSRTSITTENGWNRINTNKSATRDSVTQNIVFAYKQVAEDGEVSFTVSESTTNKQRLQINLIAIHNGGTPSLLSDIEKVSSATSSKPIVITKPCNELVIWATSVIAWTESYKWQTDPKMAKVADIVEPRIVNFIDYRGSESPLSRSFWTSSGENIHIAALKITPN